MGRHFGRYRDNDRHSVVRPDRDYLCAVWTTGRLVSGEFSKRRSCLLGQRPGQHRRHLAVHSPVLLFNDTSLVVRFSRPRTAHLLLASAPGKKNFARQFCADTLAFWHREIQNGMVGRAKLEGLADGLAHLAARPTTNSLVTLSKTYAHTVEERRRNGSLRSQHQR